MRALALIPARGGSKGIVGKNLRKFAGVPLVSLAVRAAQLAELTAYVSTESLQIQHLAHGECATIIARPKALATDEATMLDVVRHAVDAIGAREFDVVVLLQPTQPLRKPEHIRAALALLEQTGADSVVSVVQIPAHYSPDYAMEILDGRLSSFLPMLNLSRRQDCRPAYSRDGTVYAIRRQTIEAGSLYGQHCVPLVIPAHESCNLDTEEDWTRAEAMVRT